MVDASDLILGALSKLWHLIPIVIFIILFKKFMNNKDKKNRLKVNEENEKNGLTLVLRTRNKYEGNGYKVEDDKQDQGIDLLCTKDNKTLLVQCKDCFDAKSITEDDIKAFHSTASKYIKANEIAKKDVEFRYVVPYKDVLAKSAIKILMNDSYNCKYVVL